MAVRKERQKPIELDAKYRGTCFEEVSKGFDKERAMLEADRCLNCKNAQCKKGCPVGVNIPEFIQKVKEEDLVSAAKIIKSTSNLPSICGRVCPQERQCEKYCLRGKMEGAVAIGALERYVADSTLNIDFGGKFKDKNGKKVAVIGSGPAGLTCAADLAKEGFEVEVFEALHKTGGVLTYGIPEFRLPKGLVQAEINTLKKLGVKFTTNTVIGKTLYLSDLEEEFDAIFIGTGAGLPIFMNIPGENLSGVYSSNEYLTRVNLMKAYDKNSPTPVQRGKNIVVVGAGNVAMDSARTALRMGADEVTVVYRRSREEMPARAEEIHHAEEEGIKFNLLTSPLEILGENGLVSGIKCEKMELSETDESGRRKPIPIKDSEFIIPCDMVIMAIGTSPNPLLTKSCKELELTKKGTIIVNEETMATSKENVYAGGDAVSGSATVILAMGAGKKAAKAIVEKLK